MKDRTEEIKALREFLKENPGTDASWLATKVKELRNATVMFAALPVYKQDIIRTLLPFHAVEYAYHDDSSPSCPKLEWQPYNGDCSGSYPHMTYRVAPDYQLPDLTEEVKPRYADGTWLHVRHVGCVEVVDRELHEDPYGEKPIEDWVAVRYSDGRVYYADRRATNWSGIDQLPPKPTLQDGWELTGKAVCCDGTQKLAENESFAYWDSSGVAGSPYVSVCSSRFNKWRWVARRVEVKKEPVEFPIGTQCSVVFDANDSQPKFHLPPTLDGYTINMCGAGIVSIKRGPAEQ